MLLFFVRCYVTPLIHLFLWKLCDVLHNSRFEITSMNVFLNAFYKIKFSVKASRKN